MGKIVIPKHSADIDEMNAVLKIHYEANDWVASKNYTDMLKRMIGDKQYSSSYPKKAQVPTYYGFIECKMTPGKKISERRITASGKKMYEAILLDNIAERQEILMDAIENVIFGRDNGGCASSDSDIDAPDLAIRCILDTGYCTSHEYAYMIWNLHDNGKKYYESLPDILKARSAGGITLQQKAKVYTDWKPILALIRWGFLVEAEDERQKVMIHPAVYERFRERLENIRIYNVDKREKIEIVKDEIEETVDKSVFKPFIISEASAIMIRTGELKEDVVSVERQHIFPGDSVLFVNQTMSRLLAYHSYLINDMHKYGTKYRMSIKMEGAVNKKQEKLLLTELKEEAKKQDENSQQGIIWDILKYKNCTHNIKSVSDKNFDIEPVNLVIRTLLELQYLYEEELKFLLSQIVLGNLNYTEAIEEIKYGRESGIVLTGLLEAELNYSVIYSLADSRLLEWTDRNNKKILRINPKLNKSYLEQFKRLMIYAVDIQKKGNTDEESHTLPLSIKSLVAENEMDTTDVLSTVTIDPAHNQEIVQGDYVIFVSSGYDKIMNYIVYQVTKIKSLHNKLAVELSKHNYINKDKEDEILKDLKEAHYGEC